MDILKICGAAIVCALSSSLLKKLGAPVASSVAVAGIVLLLSLSLPKIADAAAFVKETAGDGFEYMSIVLKVTAVALISEASCRIAEASGEQSLSSALGAAGKIEIIYLALPLLHDLFDGASSVASLSS